MLHIISDRFLLALQYRDFGTPGTANVLAGISDRFNAPVVMAIIGLGFILAVRFSVAHFPLRRIYFLRVAPEPSPA